MKYQELVITNDLFFLTRLIGGFHWKGGIKTPILFCKINNSKNNMLLLALSDVYLDSRMISILKYRGVYYSFHAKHFDEGGGVDSV